MNKAVNTKNRRPKLVPVVLILIGVGVLATGALLLRRALSGTNDVALTSKPKGVTALTARRSDFRPLKRYVGAIEPWVSARIGPQLVSAYVQTVLVRPGDLVKKDQVLATLDCRDTSALAKSISMQAAALEQTQTALAREAARVDSLLDGGFVSPNEAELKSADSASKQAQLLGIKAQLIGTELHVSDCILRAPFDGEIGERLADPGAYARPGTAVVTVVDRATVRVTADVPESDFEAVAPGAMVKLQVLATGLQLQAPISRRAPTADADTRTIHLEIDVPNKDRSIPAGTTATLTIEVGHPVQSIEVPLSAASVRGETALVMTVKDGLARQKSVHLIGERDGKLYLDPSLGEGTPIVVEGRAALVEGDQVTVREVNSIAPAPSEVDRQVNTSARKSEAGHP